MDRLLEITVLEGLDLPAAVAHEMMMVVAAGMDRLVARNARAKIDPLDEPFGGEELEHPIHARDSDLSIRSTQSVENLLRAQTAVLRREQVDHRASSAAVSEPLPQQDGDGRRRPVRLSDRDRHPYDDSGSQEACFPQGQSPSAIQAMMCANSTSRVLTGPKGDTMKDFKAFLLRGNLVDMAVGIVIGVAFTAVVTALVGDLVTPLLAAIGGKPDFSSLSFTINKSHFLYGSFLNAVISFALIAAVLFYFVVKPVNTLVARARREPTPDPTTRHCPECVSEIALAARRCAFCTAEVTPLG
jgi:large conductance mechanosensitive channel